MVTAGNTGKTVTRGARVGRDFVSWERGSAGRGMFVGADPDTLRTEPPALGGSASRMGEGGKVIKGGGGMTREGSGRLYKKGTRKH